MLLGKLAKPATKVYQDGVFSTKTEIAEYLVVCTQFVIGENKTSFELRFGNIITENEKERFDILLRHFLEMTSQELSTWGTDDSVLLDIIAQKLGTTLLEKVNKDLHYTY